MSAAQRLRFAWAQHQARHAPVEEKLRAALTARERADAAHRAAAAVLPPDAELIAYCSRAAETTRSPSSFLSVITPDAQILKAGHGLRGVLEVGEPVPIVNAICALVAAHDEPLAVTDVRTDPALGRCLVLGGVRAYNGAPVHLDGHAIGALAVADTTPRRWSATDRDTVAQIAELVSLRVTELTRTAH